MAIINTMTVITLSWVLLLSCLVFRSVKRKQQRHHLMSNIHIYIFAWHSDERNNLQSCDCFYQVAQNNWSYHYKRLVAFLLGTGDSLLQSFYIAKQDVENAQLYNTGQFHNFSAFTGDSEISPPTIFPTLLSMLFLCVRLIFLYNPASLLIFQGQIITTVWTGISAMLRLVVIQQ